MSTKLAVYQLSIHIPGNISLEVMQGTTLNISMYVTLVGNLNQHIGRGTYTALNRK